MKKIFILSLKLFSLSLVLVSVEPAEAVKRKVEERANEREVPVAKKQEINKDKEELPDAEPATTTVVKETSLGTLNIFVDEILQSIFYYLIPEHSTIACVNKAFQEAAYNATYWREMCIANNLNLKDMPLPAFVYFKEQVACMQGPLDTPEAWIQWAPHLERLPYSERDKHLNKVPFNLYNRIAKHGSEHLKSLGRLHSWRMQVEKVVIVDEPISDDALAAHLKSESDLQKERAKFIKKTAASDRKEIFSHYLKVEEDLLHYICLRLEAQGLGKLHPRDYNDREDGFVCFNNDCFYTDINTVRNNEFLPSHVRMRAEFFLRKEQIEAMDPEYKELPEFQENFNFLKETPLLPEDAAHVPHLLAIRDALYGVSDPDFPDEKIFAILTDLSANAQTSSSLRPTADYLRSRYR